jgi:hypothetical protein
MSSLASMYTVDELEYSGPQEIHNIRVPIPTSDKYCLTKINAVDESYVYFYSNGLKISKDNLVAKEYSEQDGAVWFIIDESRVQIHKICGTAREIMIGSEM